MSTIQEEAAKDAERTRLAIWGTGIPVDPVHVAKALGVDTFRSSLDPTCSAVLSKKVGRDPVIILNESDSETRQRFSCAHELGHFVRRANRGELGDEFEYIELRGPLARQGTDDEEIYANTFAATLLMPEDYVRDFARQKLTVVEQAFKFEVSPEALDNRLKYLRIAL